MKKRLAILIALALMLSIVAIACDSGTPAAEPTPAPTPAPVDPPPAPPPPAPAADKFVWNNYADRQPGDAPEYSSSGVNIWWNNWDNLRASNENGAVTINYRPGGFDPEDYDDVYDFVARPGDWMGNFGEAVNMWALDGIQYCKYLNITVAGAAGGEEQFLILHFQPEDGPFFGARFADLVTKDGGNPEITTEMQEIVIDLEASGFPGMTNRMHIRSFAECTIMLEEISFTEPTGPIDTDSPDSIIAGFSVQATGEGLQSLPINSWVQFEWNNYSERDPDNKPDYSTSGVNIWWDNWDNLEATQTDIGVQIEFKPAAFDSRDYDDEDDYYARATNWMGNFGEAVNMWALDDIAYCRYLVINMMGLEGGEEDKLILHFQPEDGPAFSARLSDMNAAGGGYVVIPSDMQGAPVVIDLQASGFPGMTNRMHIRAFAEAGIVINSISFLLPVAALDPDDPLGGITIPPIGDPNSLPVSMFVEQAS